MDIRNLQRSTRTARKATALPARPDTQLTFIKDLPEIGERILLDTCVYIDQLHGTLPIEIESRVTSRTSFHSSLALSELCFAFGRLDPNDSRSQDVWDAYEDLLTEIPAQRILAPSSAANLRGGIHAGVMARLLGYNKPQQRKGLIDALLGAQASEEQILLVTRNTKDFDRLSQLDSKLRVAFYRK